MNTVELQELFDIEYGNQLNLNQMDKSAEYGDEVVNFVSRRGSNLGVSDKVQTIPDEEPYSKGLITVALGGAILSSFVQSRPFYTAQNIKVLSPIEQMDFVEKVYYCLCIESNQFRYSTYGREANKTLHKLQVPAEVPEWVSSEIADDVKSDMSSSIETVFSS